jgi:hypothetical protein
MKPKPTRQPPLRKIAESVLKKYLGDLDDAVREELATSLVRQWLTHDGHGGFVLPTSQCWFQLVKKGDGFEVGFDRPEGHWGRALPQGWQLAEDEVPAVLHRLNVCQSVQCRNADGRTVRLWIEPKERAVRCRELAGEEE